MTESNSRADFQKIIESLTGEQRGEDEYLCRCPAHDDHTPSLKVDLKNGRILVRCYSGCEQEAVIAALRDRDLWHKSTNGAGKNPPGIPVVWPTERMLKARNLSPGPENQREFVQCWAWKDENGTIEGFTALYFGRGKKDVIPFFKRYKETTRWSSGFPKEMIRPIFARDVLAKNPDAMVWIVEGEKKAEALISRGQVATTWPGGAKSWGKADYSSLKGRKIALWPDKDAPGRAAMKGLGEFLLTLDCKVRVVDVDKIPELSESEDVFDWFSRGKTVSDLESIPFFGEKKAEKSDSEASSDEDDVDDLGIPNRDRPYGEYESFFVEKLGPARKDIFTGDVMTFDEDERLWLPIDTESNLSFLRSQAAIEKYRRLKLTTMKDHFLGTYLRSKRKEFIPEIPAWDGRDYLKEFASACSIKNVSAQCYYEYLCQWGALMIDRVFNPMVQNQILILTGEEGGGKSTYIYNLVKGLGQWSANFTVHNQEKDNYEQVASSAVLILDEFERLTKHEQGLIKNLITTPRQRYRPSHERKHQTKMMRASWISTTNLDDILKSSGKNRRFVIFEIGSIDWNYPQDQSIQILAEWKELARRGFRVSDESRIEMEAYIASKTPQAFMDEVVQEFLERVEQHRQSNDPSQTNFTNEDLDKVFERVQREFQVRPTRLKKELKDRGLEGRFRRGAKQYRGWTVPIPQDEDVERGDISGHESLLSGERGIEQDDLPF